MQAELRANKGGNEGEERGINYWSEYSCCPRNCKSGIGKGSLSVTILRLGKQF